MSLLTLPKTYGDFQLLFKSDIDNMWSELEAFINGGITSDNVVAGWASFSQIELEEDMNFYLGTSAFIRFEDNTLYFLFDDGEEEDFIIRKESGVAITKISNEGILSSSLDIFQLGNSNYSFNTLMNYSKPVLVYTDSDTVTMQQNVTVANRSLIVFPSGIVDVTEDVSSTHKFRQLKLSATANGYDSAHTGAADSGMRAGLTLTENTWYFVYAVIVRGGSDVGKFIMVVDDRSPVPFNWSGLDTTYGAGNWVYLGPLRYGHGEALATTLVPFIMDHQGWIQFVGAAATDNFFGIRLTSTIISDTTYQTVWQETTGNEGESIPENFSFMKLTYRPVDSTNNEMCGQAVITDSADNIIYNLPSFSVTLDPGEAHGFEVKIPCGVGVRFKMRIGA